MKERRPPIIRLLKRNTFSNLFSFFSFLFIRSVSQHKFLYQKKSKCWEQYASYKKRERKNKRKCKEKWRKSQLMDSSKKKKKKWEKLIKENSNFIKNKRIFLTFPFHFFFFFVMESIWLFFSLMKRKGTKINFKFSVILFNN